MVENQQVEVAFGAKAGIKFSGVCADAHVEHTLSVQGLMQEDLVGWTSLVDQYGGLVHEPLLVGGPANLRVALGAAE
ncbi:hypothetical protein D3C76_1640780 [compost metagenome]